MLCGRGSLKSKSDVSATFECFLIGLIVFPSLPTVLAEFHDRPIYQWTKGQLQL